MAEVALRNIHHIDEEGNVYDFVPGDKVTHINKDDLDRLRENGAYGEGYEDPAKVEEERASLLDQIAKLQADLEAANSKNQATVPSASTSETSKPAPATAPAKGATK